MAFLARYTPSDTNYKFEKLFVNTFTIPNRGAIYRFYGDWVDGTSFGCIENSRGIQYTVVSKDQLTFLRDLP